jgi:hypothetical protein
VRRLLKVLLSLLAAIGVGGGATLASSSAAQGVIVCPLARGVLIPCCGPPTMSQRQPADVQPICCPQGPPCPARLTIGSSPNPSKSSDSVVISGNMPTAAASTKIALWQRLPGQSQFKQMTTTNSDSSGAYSIKRSAGHVQTNREWYVTAGALKSTTISQQVEATVTLTGRFNGPRSATLTGSVQPSHARERLTIERKSGRTWQAVGHPLLNRHSRYKLKLRLALNHAIVLRAVLPADARNVLSTSPTLKLAIRT